MYEYYKSTYSAYEINCQHTILDTYSQRASANRKSKQINVWHLFWWISTPLLFNCDDRHFSRDSRVMSSNITLFADPSDSHLIPFLNTNVVSGRHPHLENLLTLLKRGRASSLANFPQHNSDCFCNFSAHEISIMERLNIDNSDFIQATVEDHEYPIPMDRICQFENFCCIDTLCADAFRTFASRENRIWHWKCV